MSVNTHLGNFLGIMFVNTPFAKIVEAKCQHFRQKPGRNLEGM